MLHKTLQSVSSVIKMSLFSVEKIVAIWVNYLIVPACYSLCNAFANDDETMIVHTQIDITKQGDNIYDIVDSKDHAVITNALSDWGSEEVNIRCRIALSRYTRRQPSFFDEKVSGLVQLPSI